MAIAWKECQIRLFVLVEADDDFIAFENEIRMTLTMLRIKVHSIRIIGIEGMDEEELSETMVRSYQIVNIIERAKSVGRQSCIDWVSLHQ